MEAKDIKAEQKWRPKAAPEFPVTLVNVTAYVARYENPRSGFIYSVPLVDFLNDWEPCDAEA